MDKDFDIKYYFFSKMFFSKRVIIDKPGVIINKLSRKYGGDKSQHRVVYFFEDVYVDLQLKTIDKIGKEKTDMMYYEIGKDYMQRYFLFSKAKKPPSFLTSSILRYMLLGFRSSGFSVAKNTKYNNDKRWLMVNGEDNIICRKSGVCSYAAGVMSAVMSFLHGKNIEAESIHESNNPIHKCKIIASEKIKEKYKPVKEELQPSKDYFRLNSLSNSIDKNLTSFSTLLKFNKIFLDKNEKLHFLNKIIIPAEISWFEIIVKKYRERGIIKLLAKTTVESVEEIMLDLLQEHNKEEKRIKAIRNLLAGFGWGVVYINKRNKKVIVDIICPPYSRFGFSYQSFFMNGCINAVFKGGYKIEKIQYQKRPVSKLNLIFNRI